MNSISESSTSSDSEFSQKCRVCAQEINGMYHYGAVVCRACAAFFRRALTSPYPKKCRLNQKCKFINEKGYFICKYCRLKRCYDVGMTTKNFQWNRDAHSTAYRTTSETGIAQVKIQRSVDQFLGRSSLIIFNSRRANENGSGKSIIDFRFLIGEALDVLKRGPESPLLAKSKLEKLSYGLNPILKFSTNQNSLPKYGKEEALAEIQHDLLAVTKWLTYFDEFLNLAPKLQIQICQACWSLWWKLEKLMKTAKEIRRNFSEDEIRSMKRDSLLYSFDKRHVDVSWLSRYSLDELQFFLDIPTEVHLDSLTLSMIELQPSDVELSYMLGQLCFHYVGKRFRGEILRVADKFQETLANDLHDYYTREMSNPYYMKRLAHMMRINKDTVCQQPCNGKRHYGAVACRACAAFFRRVGTRMITKPCQRNQKCEMLKNQYFTCKYCRLHKCLEVGMRPENFQFGRDNNHQIPSTMDTILGEPNLIIFRVDQNPKKNFLDFQYLIEKVLIVLQMGPETPFFAESRLKKLGNALSPILCSSQTVNPLELKYGKNESLRQMEHVLMLVTKWFTNFDDFQNLPIEIKLKMIQSIWSVWWKLERIAWRALEIRRKFDREIIRRTKVDTVIYSTDASRIDMSWLSSYSVEQLKFFMNISTEVRLNSLTLSMIELQPSDVELSYMLGQLCFHYVGKRFQGEILRVADKFQETLANDLHDYYIREVKRPHYVSRVAQMMKINNQIQMDLYRSKVRTELALVFDIFKVEVSHPEMFVEFSQ